MGNRRCLPRFPAAPSKEAGKSGVNLRLFPVARAGKTEPDTGTGNYRQDSEAGCVFPAGVILEERAFEPPIDRSKTFVIESGVRSQVSGQATWHMIPDP